MYNEGKRLFEKIKLTGYKPTPEELKTMEGTAWHHKLHGTTPKPNSLNFKAYYEDGQPEEKKEFYLKQEVAEYLVDKIEHQFNAHFSDHNLGIVDNSKLLSVKRYAMSVLKSIETGEWIKSDLAGVINRATDVNELLVRLSLAAS